MIYFIKNTALNHIKIGSTSDINRRLLELQTGNSTQLRVLYVIEIPDDESLRFERHVQGVCQRFALEGEWFTEDAITHLLNHPWFKENMKPIRQLPTPRLSELADLQDRDH